MWNVEQTLNLPRLNPEETANTDTLVSSRKIQLVRKSLPQRKARGPDSLTGKLNKEELSGLLKL